MTEGAVIAAMLTKSDHWAYEKEWRLLRKERGVGALPEGVISGVVLGCAISKAHRELVIEWAGNCSRPISVYSARIKPEQYALATDLID